MTTNATMNKALEADVKEIYLGNLATVDCDLELPKTGKRGTSFSWSSNEILFISHTGEVTRPTFGVGNREVELTVTARLGNDIQQKNYVATVLEEVPETTIVQTENLKISLKEAKKHLPTVCAVLLDNGNYTTAEVEWLDMLDVTKKEQVLRGQVKKTGQTVLLKIVDSFTQDKLPEKSIASLSTQLTEDSSFKQASLNMLEHLRGLSLDQLLYSFRKVAELSTEGAEPMTGWDAPECNLKGHTTGHYLSAIALAAYSTQEEHFYKQVDYLISSLSECQNALERLGMSRGFLSAYTEEQFDLLEVYTTYPKIWAPYYTLDKIFQGCLDCYEFAESEQALEIAKKIGDWTYERLSKLSSNQLNQMWSIYIAGEFGGMISALMRLYHFTDEKSYLEAAVMFENDKLFIPIKDNFDTLDGVHANQHIPQIIGALDIYEETGDNRYLTIAQNFWEMITQHHAYSIGGVGETEMFKAPDAIADYLTTKSAESCASYNLLKLTKKLFDLSPQARYFDYYENVLHNHLLSATSHDCNGGTTYFMPTSPGAKKQFDTDENTCCHGTGLESLLRFQKDIFAFTVDTAYVNLFYPSVVKWVEKETTLHQTISQNQIVLSWSGHCGFNLKIRIPEWATFEEVTVNGVLTSPSITTGYLEFELKEQEGEICIAYQPKIRVISANDDPTFGSIAYGKDILAIKSAAKEFISIQSNDLKDLVQTEEGYQLKNHQLVPLNQINHESYHLYLKINE